LEELVPEKKESTSLEDRPDPAAGEAPASKRRSRQRRWRERGSGVEELPKWAVHPDALYLYGQTAWADYLAHTWTGYSGPRIIRPGTPLLRKFVAEKLDLCAWRECLGMRWV
jgi:hypothetical protein